MITPTACLGVLAERGVLPSERQAVYIAGSLIRGWGNLTSDLDVYVVTDSPWQEATTTSSPVSVAPGTVPVNAFYVGDRRWDVEYWTNPQIEELVENVSWEAFNAGQSASNLTLTESLFINRLSCCQIVEGGGWVKKRRQQFEESAVRVIVASQALYLLDHYTEDAVGMRASNDMVSAVLAARQALGFAVDALLASHGELETQPKWRARRMRTVLPPELSFDEYWELETMQTYDKDAPERWVEEVLRCCQRIAAAVNL